jgi:8-oxo-dGTP diphosphatase
MRSSVRRVQELVRGIVPYDEVEAGHREEALRWLASTDDVFRRVKPATPSPHLVSYVVVIDPVDRSSLLVDHLNAKLWLPPGGHVEPDEDPVDAARREASEELGVEFDDPRLEFITVTETIGVDRGHTDVSLWFVVDGRRGMPLVTDPAEFGEARWWTPEQVSAAGAGVFDPHYPRFVAKLAG